MDPCRPGASEERASGWHHHRPRAPVAQPCADVHSFRDGPQRATQHLELWRGPDPLSLPRPGRLTDQGPHQHRGSRGRPARRLAGQLSHGDRNRRRPTPRLRRRADRAALPLSVMPEKAGWRIQRNHRMKKHTWYVTFEIPWRGKAVRGRRSRSTLTFETEMEARNFARAKFDEGLVVTEEQSFLICRDARSHREAFRHGLKKGVQQRGGT